MFDWYLWVGLPLLVFFARVTDVTLGTIRIIFTSRGRRHIAPLLGFVEVFIWITVIAQITKGAHNVVAYLAYAGGFAAGTYIGMFIEDKLAMGMLVIRVIIPERVKDLTAKLREKGYGFTSVDAQGSQGPVKLIYAVVMRKNLPEVAKIIQQIYPNAFFTVEELRSAEHGVFPRPVSPRPHDVFFGRKSK
ncbi:MAG: DUF2179 domain-containing protein [Anaerolineales bacterium]|nr:DUF2179 domain-containing protein [Anaerolineales bacterium]